MNHNKKCAHASPHQRKQTQLETYYSPPTKRYPADFSPSGAKDKQFFSPKSKRVINEHGTALSVKQPFIIQKTPKISELIERSPEDIKRQDKFKQNVLQPKEALFREEQQIVRLKRHISHFSALPQEKSSNYLSEASYHTPMKGSETKLIGSLVGMPSSDFSPSSLSIQGTRKKQEDLKLSSQTEFKLTVRRNSHLRLRPPSQLLAARFDQDSVRYAEDEYETNGLKLTTSQGSRTGDRTKVEDSHEDIVIRCQQILETYRERVNFLEQQNSRLKTIIVKSHKLQDLHRM